MANAGGLLALVDVDTPIVAAALSAQDNELWVAKSRLSTSISRILEASGCSSYKLFISGGDNFRKEIDPLYKANRPTEPIKWRKECEDYLVEEWGAVRADGYEADDAVGCEQRYDGSTIICGIDKDLLMISGKHYQWPIIRKGEVVREEAFYDISPEEGIRTFFEQVLTGDATDNIKGIKGVGHKRAQTMLCMANTEEDMYSVTKSRYYLDDRLDDFKKNLDLLWIWRNYGETYTIRMDTRG